MLQVSAARDGSEQLRAIVIARAARTGRVDGVYGTFGAGGGGCAAAIFFY